MSKILGLVAAATLLSLSACGESNKEASSPAAVQPPVNAEVAPKPSETVAAKPAEEKPAPAVQPAAAGAATAAKTPEAKPVETVKVVEAPKPAPVAETPAAKPEAPKAVATPAAPESKPAAITKEQALAIATKGNCLACHKIESKVVGPAWKDVGAKYKGDPNAAATIASHIKSGGKFGWNFGIMPPRGGSQISDADVAALAGFIASLK